VELLKPLAPLPNNVCRSRIRYGYGYEVTVGLSLLRECLCEVEGEAVRRYSGLLGRAILLDRLGLRRGRSGVGTRLALGRGDRRGHRRHRDGSDTSTVGVFHAAQSIL